MTSTTTTLELTPTDLILILAGTPTREIGYQTILGDNIIANTMTDEMRTRALELENPESIGAFVTGVLWERALANAPGFRESAAALGLK